jgi:Domain of unknown function (DUF1707)
VNEQLRLSDAEREEAARVLGEHFAVGRLTAEEHAERHDQIFAARTYGELPSLFADLPGGLPFAPTVDRRPRRSPRIARAWGGSPPWGVLRVVAMMIIAIVVVTHLPLILVGLVAWWLIIHRGWRHRRGTARHPRAEYL